MEVLMRFVFFMAMSVLVHLLFPEAIDDLGAQGYQHHSDTKLKEQSHPLRYRQPQSDDRYTDDQQCGGVSQAPGNTHPERP